MTQIVAGADCDDDDPRLDLKAEQGVPRHEKLDVAAPAMLAGFVREGDGHSQRYSAVVDASGHKTIKRGMVREGNGHSQRYSTMVDASGHTIIQSAVTSTSLSKHGSEGAEGSNGRNNANPDSVATEEHLDAPTLLFAFVGQPRYLEKYTKQIATHTAFADHHSYNIVLLDFLTHKGFRATKRKPASGNQTSSEIHDIHFVTFPLKNLASQCTEHRNTFSKKQCAIWSYLGERAETQKKDGVYFIFDLDTMPTQLDKGLEHFIKLVQSGGRLDGPVHASVLPDVGESLTQSRFQVSGEIGTISSSGPVISSTTSKDSSDAALDVLLYWRAMSDELMAGNYVVKNSIGARRFLQKWLAYDISPPVGWHSRDMGDLQLHVAETFFKGYSSLTDSVRSGDIATREVRGLDSFSAFELDAHSCRSQYESLWERHAATPKYKQFVHCCLHALGIERKKKECSEDQISDDCFEENPKFLEAGLRLETKVMTFQDSFARAGEKNVSTVLRTEVQQGIRNATDDLQEITLKVFVLPSKQMWVDDYFHGQSPDEFYGKMYAGRGDSPILFAHLIKSPEQVDEIKETRVSGWSVSEHTEGSPLKVQYENGQTWNIEVVLW